MSLRLMISVAAVVIVLLVGIIGPDAVESADWPQWCGSDGKNMVSSEKGLPESFVPGTSTERRDDRSVHGQPT